MSQGAKEIKYPKDMKTFCKSTWFWHVFLFRGLGSDLCAVMKCWEKGPYWSLLSGPRTFHSVDTADLAEAREGQEE